MDTEQHNEQISRLKEENDYLMKQLEKTNEKLKESDAFKSHFISNITNEIINPFASILGISKNISLLDEKRLSQIHSMSNLIYNEAFDLDFQLQNIFSAAKIESGEMNMELSSINPTEIVEEIIESLRFKSEKKNQYIELEIDNHLAYNLVTDKDKFQIIIKNLISNAIIFGYEKTKISVTMKQVEEKLMVQISNIGDQMDEEELNLIFDRFTKLDKTINSINQGHGLGLSVTKAYLEFLEGEIEVYSNETEGNVFKIFISAIANDEDTLIREDDLFIDDSELF
ncbi:MULTISPECIES: sensor histidine kinase KdpD [unclassified Lentimicrobium]|uniref:sensor histidine kinase n=1 Tax=unclassified Lentimicrobium TaxID=2677434 RepID=UPI0015569DDE|nr:MULTISPECIES: HAMP domain-containing sensor histidine kinase [unclassified Lentimicrobium]NPD45680.1 HAMP domain-containing histidine kinase [Lentimicrobium sp. S6]NPD85559.1 HAMP domain-containing histidine kinase [Lentimicrobium sp. L6]